MQINSPTPTETLVNLTRPNKLNKFVMYLKLQIFVPKINVLPDSIHIFCIQTKNNLKIIK